MPGLIEVKVSMEQTNPEVVNSRIRINTLRISVQDINEKLKFDEIIDTENNLFTKHLNCYF